MKRFKRNKRKQIAVEQAKKINARNYSKEYLTSIWWINRRKRYWATYPKECHCCSEPATELHHNNYGFLYREQDQHLVPLCNDCHNQVHELIKNDPDCTLLNAHVIYKKLLKYSDEFDYYTKHLDSI